MNFGEYVRGGTAPSIAKTKAPSNLNPYLSSRPKTRSVDNDYQDLNIDLKNNRVKSSHGGSPDFPDDGTAEREIARISLNEWNDRGDGKTDSTAKRAPSRGKKSKDPMRKDNPLMPGVSAYTQNMPNIVLNTNRRPTSKGGPTNPSPRTTKELRNISQINELRAAYGADILNKPNSPGKQKNPRTTSTNDPINKFPFVENASRVESRGTTNLRKTSFETGSVASSTTSSKAEVETYERGREISSNRSTVSSSSEISSSPTRKLKKNNALLKASFSSKQSDESNFDLNNLEQVISKTPTEEEDPAKDRALSPDNVLIPVDDFLNQVITEGAAKKKKKNESEKTVSSSKGSSCSSSHLNKNSSSMLKDPEKGPSPQELSSPVHHHLTSLSFSDYTLGGGEPTADDVFMELNEPEIPEDDMLPVYDSREGKLSSSQYPGAVNTEVKEEEEKIIRDREVSSSTNRKLRSFSEDPSAAVSYREPLEIITNTTSSTSGKKEEANNTTTDQNQDEVTPRPQSRKLYLGSDKNMRDITKTPKSAGARYGTYSPVKGGMEQPPEEVGKSITPKAAKKSQFRKLSSHGDLSEWVDETTADIRPPSRQSTAFPVHLSSEPGSAGSNSKNAPATPLSLMLPTSQNTTNPSPTLLASPSSASQHNKMEILLNTNDITSSEIDESSTPTSTRANRLIAVNTEPKTVKKTIGRLVDEDGRGGAGNSASSVTMSGNTATATTALDPSYQQRPPSRQKVAAQHLFDTASPSMTMPNNASIESISLTSRRTSRAEIMAGVPSTLSVGFISARRPDTSATDYYEGGMSGNNIASSGNLRTTTAVGSSRATTTRGRPTPAYDSDYNDDGFAELDPNESQDPFPITINYGYETAAHYNHSTGGVATANNNLKNAPTDSLLSEKHMMRMNKGQAMPPSGPHRMSVEDFPTDRSYEYGTKKTPRQRNNSYGSPTRSSRTSANLEEPTPASLRPKSVIAIPGNSPSRDSATAAAAHRKGGGVYHDGGRQEDHTLRSRSANNYHHQNRLYHPIHTNTATNSNSNRDSAGDSSNRNELGGGGGPYHHPPPSIPSSKPIKNHPPPASSQASRTKAWGDQPDPRHIPRAQNVFGLEADTEWTSPALLGNPFSSTTINDNFIIQDDDDEMTILTEESEGYNHLVMDNSLSVQSFNIETSLDEDFLKLFAPGR